MKCKVCLSPAKFSVAIIHPENHPNPFLRKHLCDDCAAYLKAAGEPYNLTYEFTLIRA